MNFTCLQRAIASTALSIALIFWCLLVPGEQLVGSSSYLIYALLILLALPMPSSIGMLLVIAGLGSFLALEQISILKASMTGLPLMFLDLQITARDPDGFIGAMKWPAWGFYGSIGAIITLLVFLLVAGIRAEFAKHGRPGIKTLSASLAAVATFAAAFAVFSQQLYMAVKPPSKYMQEAWSSAGIGDVLNQIGVIPFVIFTSKLDFDSTNNRFSSAIPRKSHPLEPETDGARRFVTDGPARDKTPNIVMVLLESTFDVNKTFEINPRLETTLSADYEGALIRGAFDVNAVGAGTWLSEFETLTGVDSRLFGLAGLYTHVTAAPMMNGSIVTWLEGRNYQATSFYPVWGDFFNARSAYKKYGFNQMFDYTHFKLKNPWFLSDESLITNFLTEMKSAADKPLFAYMLTIANHSPHPCVNFDKGNMPYRFIGVADPMLSCELNEYIHRQKQTEAGIQKLEAHLQDLEARTGRPYVLALFGDHQPGAFTNQKGPFILSGNDYRLLRRIKESQTFYQIRGSAVSPFKTKVLDIPSILLPSMVSAFVTNSVGDLYMGVNFDVFANCGSPIPAAALTGSNGGYDGKTLEPFPACAATIDRAIASYKQKGLVK